MFLIQLIVIVTLLLPMSLSHRFNRVSSQKNPIFEKWRHGPRPEPPRWSEIVLVKMHYDCSGRLVRKEISDIQTKENIIITDELKGMNLPNNIFGIVNDERTLDFPKSWEENIVSKHRTPFFYTPSETEKNSFKNLDREFAVEETIDNNILEGEGQNELKSSLGNTQEKDKLQQNAIRKTKPSLGFADFTRSQPGRFRKPPPKALLEKIADSKMPSAASPSSSSLPTIVITDDRIIDSPIRPCSEGFNFDLAGNCKPVFLDN